MRSRDLGLNTDGWLVGSALYLRMPFRGSILRTRSRQPLNWLAEAAD